ncbi:MAG: Mur ligase family protein, partial [Marinilabilia sp.]
IPSAFTNPSSTLVIYTPAVPAGHQQLDWFRQKDFKVLKRSRVLGLITEDMKSVCVAGTHGKTTVSTLTAYLLHNSSLGANAFLGGIPKNFGTNFLHDPNSDLVVLEADEFDRSFWQLTPSTALITSMDADHLDVYGNSDKVKEGFTGFAARIKEKGRLLIKAGLPVPEGLAEGVEVFTYSRENEADYKIINLKYHKGLYSFDLKTPEGKISGFTSGMPGLVNVENAAAALALCLMHGADPDELKRALPRFQGIARRFDVLIDTPYLVYIDDYAHHPEEIRATLESVRDAYPDREVTGVFQPHLYTRTRDFAEAFASALDEGLDHIILLPVYPAREEPIPGVDSALIAKYLSKEKCLLIEKEELIPVLKKREPDILITLGAGDIDRLVPAVHEWGEKKLLHSGDAG